MEYIRLGDSSLKISRLSLGAMGFGDPAWRSWVLREEAAKEIIGRALDHGINLLDTCNYYSSGASEELIGRLLGGFIRRDDVLIATKYGSPMGSSPNARGYSRKNTVDSVDASLERLGVDYIDLYQTHIWDPEACLEEFVDGVAHVVNSGKVLYVGVTDIPTWQFVKIMEIAKSKGLPRIVSTQNHYNLLWRTPEAELLPYCRAEGIGVLPYSPAARGFLSGTARRADGGRTERARTDNFADEWYNRKSDASIAEEVEKIAMERNISPTQVAIAWVLAQPSIHSPIFGATRPQHVDEAVETISIALTDDEMQRLEALYEPRMNARHG